jgi:hypothetical protein
MKSKVQNATVLEWECKNDKENTQHSYATEDRKKSAVSLYQLPNAGRLYTWLHGMGRNFEHAC